MSSWIFATPEDAPTKREVSFARGSPAAALHALPTRTPSAPVIATVLAVLTTVPALSTTIEPPNTLTPSPNVADPDITEPIAVGVLLIWVG